MQKRVKLIIIFLIFMMTSQINIEVELAKVQTQRLSIFAGFSDLRTPLADSVVKVYKYIQSFINLKIDTDEIKLVDFLTKIATYRSIALGQPSDIHKMTDNEIIEIIKETIKGIFNIDYKINEEEFLGEYSAGLMTILSQLRNLLFDELFLQFDREIRKQSNDVVVTFYMNVLSETGRLLSNNLRAISESHGFDLTEELENITQILVNFQDLFMNSYIIPIKKLAQLFKAPMRAIKGEVLNLIYNAYNNKDFEVSLERINLLLEVCEKILPITNEENTFIQIYLVSAGLKSANESQVFDEFINKVIAQIMSKMYYGGSKTKVRELISNLCLRFSSKKIQPAELRTILTHILETNKPNLSLEEDKPLTIIDKLRLIDTLIYVDTEDIPESIIERILDYFEIIIAVDRGIILTASCSKPLFSEMLIEIKKHLDYYEALYELLNQFFSEGKIKTCENWNAGFDQFLDKKFLQNQLIPEHYVILKVHNLLYTKTDQDFSVKFGSFLLTTSIFENGRFKAFRNMFLHLYKDLIGQNGNPVNDVDLVNAFSEKLITASSFNFLKVIVQHQTDTHQVQKDPEQNINFQLLVEHGKQEVSISVGPDQELNIIPMEKIDIPQLVDQPITKRSKSIRFEGNLVDLISGYISQEELALLKSHSFTNYLNGKSLVIRKGNIEQQFVFVQIIQKNNVCKNIFKF